MLGIISGDVRYTYLSQKFEKSILSNELKDFYDVDRLVLPFKGIDEKYRIYHSNLNLLDILKLNRIKTIYTGNANKELVNLCNVNKIQLYEMLKDDTFVMENAFLTAKGVLYDLSRRNIDLFEHRILLLGYGNISYFLAKIFSLWGIEFSIYTIPKHEKKYVLLEGYTSIDTIDSTFDIIINTIPMNLDIDYPSLKNSKVIDVASIPYGFDPILMEQYGIDYEIVSSIPSKFAPESAANIIKKYIENHS